MRILVTGNKGFIGQYVENRLVSAGFKTDGFDI
jgi:nucleoside-diphosphate-sugar epimerase